MNSKEDGLHLTKVIFFLKVTLALWLQYMIC